MFSEQKGAFVDKDRENLFKEQKIVLLMEKSLRFEDLVVFELVPLRFPVVFIEKADQIGETVENEFFTRHLLVVQLVPDFGNEIALFHAD